MSLYGSGRSEGVLAALLIAAIVVLARAAASWLAGAAVDAADVVVAALPALGGMLCYRLLRAQGRSRYAAFLAGAAYGLSPWLTALAPDTREQFAAALAPLALEAAWHCDRPTRRAVWLPRAGLCFALPLAAGVTVIGVLASCLCAVVLVRTITCGDRDDEHPTARGIVLAAVAGVLAGANLAWLDPLAPWLGDGVALGADRVLAAHRPDETGVDVAAVLRVPGPVLLSFALLGLLRRQRHVGAKAWWSLALAGALPTLLAAGPWLHTPGGEWLRQPQLAATGWWATLLAITVLGAAGLDDFLELPLRRRTALPWLLAFAVAAAPLLPVFGARAPHVEWPLTATFVALPLLLTTWRRIGFLRFKNWLAAMALVALTIPLLQVQPARTPLPSIPPGAPAGEFALPAAAAWAAPWQGPAWHYAGLFGAGGIACLLAAFAWRRNRHASASPSAPSAAIVKKARPSHR